MSDALSSNDLDDFEVSLKTMTPLELLDRLFIAAAGDPAQLAVLNELVGRFASIATVVRCARIAIDVASAPELLGDDLFETASRLAAMKAPRST